MSEQNNKVEESAADSQQTEKRPGLFRRWHRAHKRAVGQMVNVEGMARLRDMTKQLGAVATNEACPRCNKGRLPVWTDKDEVCPECGYVRPYIVESEDQAEVLRGQYDHLSIEEVNQIQASHIRHNRLYLGAAFVFMLIALGFVAFDYLFYGVTIVIIALTQGAVGLRHAYYHWIIENDRMFSPGNLHDWVKSGEFWPNSDAE